MLNQCPYHGLYGGHSCPDCNRLSQQQAAIAAQSGFMGISEQLRGTRPVDYLTIIKN